MASVNIYPEHRDIIDALITSGKVASVAAGTKTGPFKDQRDAYVFAASIAMAINSPTPAGKMPTSRKGVTPIRDSVFLGASGAKDLCLVASLLDERAEESVEESLVRQLDMIADSNLVGQFELLDRYAHAGFSWLAKHQEDESTIRDLVFTAIDQIECIETDISEMPNLRDPLLDMLGMHDMQL
jgi:hypothetical protein